MENNKNNTEPRVRAVSPLRDSQGKQTSKWVRRTPAALSVTHVSSRLCSVMFQCGSRFNAAGDFALSCLFIFLDYPWAERERLLVVYTEPKPKMNHNMYIIIYKRIILSEELCINQTVYFYKLKYHIFLIKCWAPQKFICCIVNLRFKCKIYSCQEKQIIALSYKMSGPEEMLIQRKAGSTMPSLK